MIPNGMNGSYNLVTYVTRFLLFALYIIEENDAKGSCPRMARSLKKCGLLSVYGDDREVIGIQDRNLQTDLLLQLLIGNTELIGG